MAPYFRDFPYSTASIISITAFSISGVDCVAMDDAEERRSVLVNEFFGALLVMTCLLAHIDTYDPRDSESSVRY